MMHDRPSDHAMSKVDARVDSSDDDRLTLIQEINRLSSNEVFMEPGQEDSDPKNVSPVPIVMALAKRKKRYRKMANACKDKSSQPRRDKRAVSSAFMCHGDQNFS